MSRKKLQILVEQSSLDRFSEIVESCRLAGMTVERQMRTVGVFSGFVEESLLDDICKVPGVCEVEESREVHGLDGVDTAPPGK
jgi:hypothetical protein